MTVEQELFNLLQGRETLPEELCIRIVANCTPTSRHVSLSRNEAVVFIYDYSFLYYKVYGRTIQFCLTIGITQDCDGVLQIDLSTTHMNVFMGGEYDS